MLKVLGITALLLKSGKKLQLQSESDKHLAPHFHIEIDLRSLSIVEEMCKEGIEILENILI